MKKMSKNKQRAYAVASYMGATLKAYEANNPELDALHLQIKRAMTVYTAQAGLMHVAELSDMLGNIWQEMGERHSATIAEDSVPALIEAFAMILPPNEYKDFLGVPTYEDEANQAHKDYNTIMKSVNMLNHKLNEALGTKSVVLHKPKEKKVKEKKPREKSKAQKAHEKEVAEIAASKERKKAFLRDRIAKAKGEK